MNPTRPGEYDVPTTPDDMAREVLAETERAEAVPAPPADAPKAPAEELTPAEQWKKALAGWKLTEDDAAKILDAMIDPGYWTKEYPLYDGRLKLRLRTRDMFHAQRVTAALALMGNLTDSEKEFVKFRYDLAGSLLEFKGRKFEHAPEGAPEAALDAAFQKRLEYVDRLAQPLWETLYRAVAHFNGLVACALANGASSGF